MLYVKHRSTASNICEQRLKSKRFYFTGIEASKCFIKHCDTRGGGGGQLVDFYDGCDHVPIWGLKFRKDEHIWGLRF